MYWRVFIAATIGTVLGAFVEPKLTAYLPDNLKGATATKATHAMIAGGAATGIYWAIHKV
jgi:hypothetical protein